MCEFPVLGRLQLLHLQKIKVNIQTWFILNIAFFFPYFILLHFRDVSLQFRCTVQHLLSIEKAKKRPELKHY